MFLPIGVRSGLHFFNKTLEMKQASGLARSPHPWHGGAVAEGTWICSIEMTKRLQQKCLNIFPMILQCFPYYLSFACIFSVLQAGVPRASYSEEKLCSSGWEAHRCRQVS